MRHGVGLEWARMGKRNALRIGTLIFNLIYNGKERRENDATGREKGDFFPFPLKIKRPVERGRALGWAKGGKNYA
jgi:hypothetical protein